MTFRISSFSVESENLRTPSVSLSKNITNPDDNYFTVIIGNNGTGKSRYISSLVEAFRDAGENRRRSKIDYHLNYQIDSECFQIERRHGQKSLYGSMNRELWARNSLNTPSKVIAITTSLSDKFPSDNFNRRVYLRKKEADEYHRDYYTYLGPRSIPGGTSSRVLMDRAMTTLISNVGEQIHNRSYRHIFDYLQYEPIVKLSYEIVRPRYFQEIEGVISESSLKKYLEEQSTRRGGMRAEMFQKQLENQPDHYWKEIVEAYNYIISESHHLDNRPQFSFVVNFSSQNEKRETVKSNLFQEKLYSFLEDLRRFDLVRGPSIRLFKKEGGEFDFSDASSGEASILSTLIALIPNLDHNSLIVIDEPEISLHPSWQYKYIELIDKLISHKNGCHVMIATHSHFLISDLPLGRSHVVHFREGRRSEISVEYIEEETHGLSAEDILLNVFDMPSTRNYYLSRNISEALELVAQGKTRSEKYHKLVRSFKKFLPNLKDVDPLKDVIRTLLELGR